MSISGRALKRLQVSFSDLRLCRDMLVVPPTEHIVRCFVFERTPYKGLFYFWRVVFPLYTIYPFLTLSLGKRLANADYIDLGEAEFARSLARLVDIIAGGELDDLRSIRTPREFLDRFGGPIVNEGYTPMISHIHAALTYYLVGNTKFCIDILEDYAGGDLRPGGVDLHLMARDLAREMRVDPSAGAKKVRALERATIERFALGPTLASTAAH